MEDIRAFASTISPDLQANDAAQAFDHRAWQACAARGFGGLTIADSGAGHDALTAVLMLEALGYGCRDNGLLFALGAHLWGCVTPLARFGSALQKETYLSRLARGDSIGALAVSEPDAGSDIQRVKTSAVAVEGGYRLNGHKIYVTNAPVADVLLVLAVTKPDAAAFGHSVFIVERGAEGLACTPTLDKLGMRTAAMGEVHLQDCFVPEANRLGAAGAGIAIFTYAMEWERAFILAPVVGAMTWLYETCVAYARERQQYSRPIAQFQAVSHRLVEMYRRIEHARWLLYRTAWRKAQGHSVMLDAAHTKLTISEAWVQTCQDALTIHGAYGYLARSGMSDIQREIMARLLKIY
jgi:alkylation response protein AidB-like acyl-CoA dehydrogenase